MVSKVSLFLATRSNRRCSRPGTAARWWACWDHCHLKLVLSAVFELLSHTHWLLNLRNRHSVCDRHRNLRMVEAPAFVVLLLIAEDMLLATVETALILFGTLVLSGYCRHTFVNLCVWHIAAEDVLIRKRKMTPLDGGIEIVVPTILSQDCFAGQFRVDDDTCSHNV